MNSLTDLLRTTDAYRSFTSLLRESCAREPVQVSGIHGAGNAFLLACMRRDLPSDALLLAVFPTQAEARKVYHDLHAFDLDRVGFFPLLPDTLGEGSADSRKSLRSERVESRAMLSTGGTIVSSIHAVSQFLPARDAFNELMTTIHVGDLCDMTEFVGRLGEAGYHRTETVELKGQFAHRGGILDVYPLTARHPLRIEFFGDEIESIREFDEASQRSMSGARSASIPPAHEWIMSDAARQEWLLRTSVRYAEAPTTTLRAHIETLTEQLFEMGGLADVELYYPYLSANRETLIDMLSEDAVVYLDEPKWMDREMERFFEHGARLTDDARAEGRLWMDSHEAYVSTDAFRERIGSRRTVEASVSMTSEGSARHTTITATPLVEEKGNLQRFLEAIPRWSAAGYRVAVFSETAKAAAQMHDVLEDHGVASGNVSTHVGTVSDGFISPTARLVVAAQEDIFGQRVVRHRQSRFRDGKPVVNLVDLQEDDHVVHTTHGIARYKGIRRMKVGADEHDFLALQYAAGDMLYVPTYNINLIQKYIGGGDKGPSVDRLGGSAWARLKSKVQRSVEDLAEELIALYAARQTAAGHAFQPDTPWQTEFEAAFPFDETPDQERAIVDVKRDMETARPMDRLLCGDVGYGKTEVAIRAAFKAVMDMKQVAILVPTTVLAQQHYLTCVERFRQFPVRARLLSRFASPKDISDTLEMLAKGTCDVVVGTHRLLSADVRFRDLGLLIIDEEHRFGVKHKERLKQMRKQVDVLTMTATPIPRTLHMAVAGARDLSVIDTPPENRLPIETSVMEYRPDTVRQAIVREVGRGGQVFFVHNRVETIESIANGLRELVPEARFEVAHGQMSESILESAMMRFIRHEFDVLVCTTIIESGLDIPNVNTILINRADALGLAQLYQLRGRVGRSDRRAYGYLFYPEDRVMTEESQKRLRVIEEFTDLGSGFKIALRDMEIRGAGNLLGPQQHGHIAAVGYDLYCKLLENAVAQRRGEPVEEEIETQIKLPVSAFIPEAFVPDQATKLLLYKRIGAIRDRSDRRALEEEIVDRFGALPSQVTTLLDVALLRSLAARLGVTSIAVGGNAIQFVVDEKRAALDPVRVLELVRSRPGARLVPPSRLIVPAASMEPRDLFDTLFDALRQLGSGASAPGTTVA